jgi:hypothetical protein
MSNFIDTYLERSRRVASLLAWLDCERESHETEAMKPQNAQNWAVIGDLEHVEELLKAPLCFLSGKSEKEINSALNDGGQGDE